LVALVILLPILVWGLVAPLPAFYIHALLVGSLEAVVLLQSRVARPRLADRSRRPDPKETVLLKYHQYFKNPVASRGLSKILSATLLVSITWAVWLLFQRAWLAAFVAGLLSYLAAPLAALLNPASSLGDMATRHPSMAIEVAAFEALREEWRAEDPEWPG
jgi:hypothetical protein